MSIKNVLHKIEPYIVLALTLKFFWIVLSGDLDKFVHPRLHTLVIFGWTILLTMIICAVALQRKNTHSHRSLFSSFAEKTAISLLILTPSSTMMPHANTQMITRTLDGQIQEVPQGAESFSFGDWHAYFNLGQPSPALAGTSVTVTGLVMNVSPDKKRADVTRLVITCCTADAYLSFFPLYFPDKLEVLEREWYEIKGVWDFTPTRGWFISVTSLKEISEPKNPYVYP